ncbi:MAG: hypothetical protein AAFZ65_09015 [Planctomycetota bacterium]
MKLALFPLPLVAAALPLVTFTPSIPAPDVPDDDQVEALIAEFFELGARATGEERTRQLTILDTLDGLPPLDRRGEKRLREDLIELWMEGPTLEKKGRNFLWEDPDRGLYIVNGKTKKPKGLLIGMHGGGAGVGDASTMSGPMSGGVSAHKWVGVYPEVLERTEHGWTDSGTEEFVVELIDRAVRTFGVDWNRVYLSGHSMGGYGTWTLGAHHADLVAGLAAAAGAPTPVLDRGTDEIVDIDWGVVPNLRNTRFVVYQSTDDPKVPADVNQFAAKRVAQAAEEWGGYEEFEYWEVSGQGHGHPPGGYDDFFERIEDFERNPYPTKIVWQPVLSWKRQFHWLTWETPTVAALVVAEVDRKAGEIRIECDREVSGMGVLLNDELVDLDEPLRVLLNGEVVFEGAIPPPSTATLVATGVSGDPGRTYAVEVTW